MRLPIIFPTYQHSPDQGLGPDYFLMILRVLMVVFTGLLLSLVFGTVAEASVQLPGNDISDKMEAAGTLLRFIDTAVFKWFARIFSGICILSSGWALKEQRFGIAVIALVGAVLFGTAPTWVKNIFEASGTQSIFSIQNPEHLNHSVTSVEVARHV